MRRVSDNKVFRIGGTAIALALVFSMILPQLARAEQRDTCAVKVPRTLAEILAQKFPSYRLPKLTDQSREDRLQDRRHGGDGCFTVASGDFGGHRRKDFVVLLASEDRSNVHLVAALRGGRSSWAIYELPTWCSGVLRCYVKAQRSGVYTRTESLPAPPSDPGDKEKIQSKHDAILSGTLESTGIVYAFKDGSWQYVWVSS